MVGILGTTD